MSFEITKNKFYALAGLVLSVLANSLLYKSYIVNNAFSLKYFCIANVIILLYSLLFLTKFKFNNKFLKLFSIISFSLCMFLSYLMIEFLNSNSIFNVTFKRFLFNLLIIVFLNLFIYSLCNKINVTIIVSNIVLFTLGVSNYVVFCFRGTPLVPWDILSINTAATVAFTYTLSINYFLLIACFLLILNISIALKSTYKIPKNKIIIITRVLCFIISVAFFVSIYLTNFINIFNLDTQLWEPVKEYSSNGFLATFLKQSKSIIVKSPEGYSQETLKNISEKYVDNQDSTVHTSVTVSDNAAKPNIIVIMDESFSDMRVHGDFKTNTEFMPYFNKLKKQTISGTVHSSVYGGKTPNSEWEFLTNNSMAFVPSGTIPYQQYISRYSYSLVSTLKAQGYQTSAIHTWHAAGYRRSNVYPLFKFDKCYFVEDYDDLEYIRNYPSDKSTFEKLIELYESRDTSKPFFNFTLTMQNHSGYDFENYTPQITLTDIQNCPKAEQYLSVINETDKALEYLINYFSNVSEDVIILFFGDHQPPYLEQEFWDNISTVTSDNEFENAENGYLVPYFIWTNYDIDKDKYKTSDISLNYLSLLLLDVANLETTPYMNFLRNLQAEIPVITGHGYIDKSGKYHNLNEKNEYSELLKEYELLEYNNVFDYSNRLDSMFSIKKEVTND